MTLIVLIACAWVVSTAALSEILGASNKATILAAILSAAVLTLIASALP